MAFNMTALRELAKELGATNFPDYRSFLAALYAEAKAREPSYSYVRFSTDIGLGSRNAHAVVQGKRALTARTGAVVAQALELRGADRRYFLATIRQTRARSAAE